MAVINVTPDSFSDGGQFYAGASLNLDSILAAVEGVLADGAALIDIGGESTRPGASPVSQQQECDRVLPVVEAVAARFDVVISVDTSTPAVMRGAVDLGAGMLNDVRALRRDGALAAAVDCGVPVCLMHMQGEPASMQQKPEYHDIVAEVKAFLAERSAACREAGLQDNHILWDPGFGFGKSLSHNLQLFNALPQLAEAGYPLLVGVSRKSMLGAVTGRDVDQRMAASVTMAALAAERGAAILRVHDVRETADALAMVAALKQEKEQV